MMDKIICPHCGKTNKIHKFCVFCGEKLPIGDDQIRLMTGKPEASCLNCGRPVKKGQAKCECGYEFSDIKCPECEAMNKYTNRFCTSCSEKLWKSNVYDYKYDESLFEPHLFEKRLPHPLRNISVFKRYKSICKPSYGDILGMKDLTIKELKAADLKVDNALCEICSRWKVVSPNYCINCFGIIKPDEYACPKCGSDFSGDKKRVEYIKNTKKYVKPVFDIAELKLSIKFTDHYLGSLAPSIGESQFEYRERLKWEFAENIIYKSNLKKAIDIALAPKPVVETYIPEVNDGGYCDYHCRYYYEEYVDEDGGPVAEATGQVFYRCELGHTTGGFCEYYEP